MATKDESIVWTRSEEWDGAGAELGREAATQFLAGMRALNKQT